MAKKTKFILTFLLFSVFSFSQDFTTEKPDYDQIEKEISNKKSDFYYPKLLEKFHKADTTMSLNEKRHLYYGFTFQDEYAPYSISDFNDSLRVVLRKENHQKADLQKIIQISNSILAENPFDIRTMNYQLYAYDQLADKTAFDKRIFQMRTIFDVLMSSGDGLKPKTAFYVINTTHEYDLLDILGFEFGGEQSLQDHYDFLKVAKNEHNIEGFYFDVSPCLNSLNRMLK
uniref:DUF4919 domain-containing protein n=1 Tax=Flavobacterium sp. TaxID=239 RepID=UPI00404A128C